MTPSSLATHSTSTIRFRFMRRRRRVASHRFWISFSEFFLRSSESEWCMSWYLLHTRQSQLRFDSWLSWLSNIPRSVFIKSLGYDIRPCGTQVDAFVWLQVRPLRQNSGCHTYRVGMLNLVIALITELCWFFLWMIQFMAVCHFCCWPH